MRYSASVICLPFTIFPIGRLPSLDLYISKSTRSETLNPQVSLAGSAHSTESSRVVSSVVPKPCGNCNEALNRMNLLVL